MPGPTMDAVRVVAVGASGRVRHGVVGGRPNRLHLGRGERTASRLFVLGDERRRLVGRGSHGRLDVPGRRERVDGLADEHRLEVDGQAVPVVDGGHAIAAKREVLDRPVRVPNHDLSRGGIEALACATGDAVDPLSAGGRALEVEAGIVRGGPEVPGRERAEEAAAQTVDRRDFPSGVDEEPQRARHRPAHGRLVAVSMCPALDQLLERREAAAHADRAANRRRARKSGARQVRLDGRHGSEARIRHAAAVHLHDDPPLVGELESEDAADPALVEGAPAISAPSPSRQAARTSRSILAGSPVPTTAFSTDRKAFSVGELGGDCLRDRLHERAVEYAHADLRVPVRRLLRHLRGAGLGVERPVRPLPRVRRLDRHEAPVVVRRSAPGGRDGRRRWRRLLRRKLRLRPLIPRRPGRLPECDP